MVAYCLIHVVKYLFTSERSKETLPSLPTIIITLLSCVQFFL